MKYKNVIFDMDGVLIDNSEGIMHCARYALGKLKIADPGDDILRKFIGPSLVYSLRTYCGATEDEAEQGMHLYREKYRVEGINMFRLYDGIFETAKALHAAGVRLSVCSGKPQEFVDKILSAAGMTDFFEVTAGAVFPARVSSKDDQMKIAMLDSCALMIGDRVFDLECAHKVGIDCAFASYGFGGPDDLTVYKPAYVINSPKEIIDIVLK